MQNPIQKFRRSSTVFEKPGILSENLKTLTSSNYLTVQYFFAETLHRFSTYQCLQERVWDFSYFVQILSYLQKLKRSGFYALFSYIFITSSRSKQNKKNPRRAFVDIGKQETCGKFQQKILNCRVIGARQSFQIFRKNTWLLENNRALSKFLYGISHYLIITIKLQGNQSVKTNFKLTTLAILNNENYNSVS